MPRIFPAPKSKSFDSLKCLYDLKDSIQAGNDAKTLNFVKTQLYPHIDSYIQLLKGSDNN